MNAATTARRDDAVLVVIDVQQRLAAAMDDRAGVATNIGKLVEVAALVGLPVLVTRQYPQGLGDIEPELRGVLERAAGHVAVAWVDKVTFDCFAEQAFCSAVEATGRRQLIVAGMETHICVAQTALSGIRAGMDVHVVADGVCSRDELAHRSALARLGSAGATLTTTESVLYELVGRAATEEFRALLRIVKG